MRMPAADVIAILEETQPLVEATSPAAPSTDLVGIDGGMDVIVPPPQAPSAPVEPEDLDIEPQDLPPIALGLDGAFFEDLDDALRTREAIEDVVAESPATRYVVFHPDLGMLIDIIDGKSYWTGIHDMGESSIGVFLDPDIPADIFSHPENLPGHDTDGIEIFQVDSGDWADLAAVGLPVDNLRFNALVYTLRTHLTTRTLQ